MNILFTWRIIHGALCTSPILFLVIAKFMGVAGDDIEILRYAALGFAIIALLLSFILPDILLNKMVSGKSPKEKISTYQTAKIIQWGLLESGAFLNAVVYYIMRNQIVLYVSLFLIGILIFLRPSWIDFQKLCKVSDSEIQTMKNGDSS